MLMGDEDLRVLRFLPGGFLGLMHALDEAYPAHVFLDAASALHLVDGDELDLVVDKDGLGTTGPFFGVGTIFFVKILGAFEIGLYTGEWSARFAHLLKSRQLCCQLNDFPVDLRGNFMLVFHQSGDIGNYFWLSFPFYAVLSQRQAGQALGHGAHSVRRS